MAAGKHDPTKADEANVSRRDFIARSVAAGLVAATRQSFAATLEVGHLLKRKPRQRSGEGGVVASETACDLAQGDSTNMPRQVGEELELAQTELDLALVEEHFIGVEIDPQASVLVDLVRPLELGTAGATRQPLPQVRGRPLTPLAALSRREGGVGGGSTQPPGIGGSGRGAGERGRAARRPMR